MGYRGGCVEFDASLLALCAAVAGYADSVHGILSLRNFARCARAAVIGYADSVHGILSLRSE